MPNPVIDTRESGTPQTAPTAEVVEQYVRENELRIRTAAGYLILGIAYTHMGAESEAPYDSNTHFSTGEIQGVSSRISYESRSLHGEGELVFLLELDNGTKFEVVMFRHGHGVLSVKEIIEE